MTKILGQFSRKSEAFVLANECWRENRDVKVVRRTWINPRTGIKSVSYEVIERVS